MRISQRKAGRAVVKRRVCPAGSVVTTGALRHRKSRRQVIRHIAAQCLSAVPLSQVAAGVSAIRRRDLQLVVVIHVALRAGSGNVCTIQRESRHGMVERCQVCPRNRVVALRTVSHRKSRSGGRVHRVICLLPRAQVATSITAVRRRDLQIVVVVGVTLCARHIGMPIGERKTRRAVVKSHRSP